MSFKPLDTRKNTGPLMLQTALFWAKKRKRWAEAQWTAHWNARCADHPADCTPCKQLDAAVDAARGDTDRIFLYWSWNDE